MADVIDYAEAVAKLAKKAEAEAAEMAGKKVAKNAARRSIQKGGVKLGEKTIEKAAGEASKKFSGKATQAGSKMISTLTKEAGEEITPDMIKEAAESLGFKTSEKKIMGINGESNSGAIIDKAKSKVFDAMSEDWADKELSKMNNFIENRMGEQVTDEGKKFYRESRKEVLEKLSKDKTAFDDDILDNLTEAKYHEKRTAQKAEEAAAEALKNKEAKANEAMMSRTTKEWKSKMYDTKQDYQRFKISEEFDGALSDFDNGKLDNDVIKNILANNEGLTKESLTRENITAAKLESMRAANGDLSLRQNMGYYKVPQKAAAAGGTVWLVNKMASSNGKQSNAQLYGQQGY